MSTEELQARGIAPSLTVSDLNRSIQFYTESLGFSVVSRHEVEGTLRFVMLKGGSGALSLGQDDFAKGRDRSKGVGVRMWVETPQDLTIIAERAKKNGVKLDSDVQALPWGQIAFAVSDPDGYKWTITNPAPAPVAG